MEAIIVEVRYFTVSFLLSLLNLCAVNVNFIKDKFKIFVKFTFEAIIYSDKLDPGVLWV